MATVLHVPAFEDNYIWLIYNDSGYAAIVDPGDEDPVIETLAQRQLQPLAILCTHHHYDHVGGATALANHYDIPVYGPGNEDIRAITSPVSDGNTVTLREMGLTFKVLSLPGHTRGHIGYYLDTPGASAVFCGDTLFSAGCGRLFEGTAAQMFDSLQKLRRLPPETRVYCAHEYTLSNLVFAQAVEPGNPRIGQYAADVRQLRAGNQPSLPSTIALELAVNPFLRSGVTEVRESVAKWAQGTLGESPENETEVFALLRRWKDVFRG